MGKVNFSSYSVFLQKTPICKKCQFFVLALGDIPLSLCHPSPFLLVMGLGGR